MNSKPHISSRMPPAFSVYLDLLRTLAALAVFTNHFAPTRWWQDFTVTYNIGFDVVILFFVLSGYLISYAADQIDKTGFDYSIHRLARIVPVSLAAVVTAMVLLAIDQQFRTDIYGLNDYLTRPVYYLAMTAPFINELWWLNVMPFGDVPYWSLTFEVWCYVIYGLAVYVRRWRWVLVVAALALTGPKQWLFLLMWLAGVAAYHYRERWRLTVGQAAVLALAPVAVYVAIKLAAPNDWPYLAVGQKVEHMLGHPLEFASRFAWGMPCAALVAVHVFAVRHLTASLQTPVYPVIQRVLKEMAGVSFTLYLFHIPLYNFWLSVLPRPMDVFDLAYKAKMYALVLVPVIALAQALERPRRWYRAIFRAALEHIMRLGTMWLSLRR